MPGQWDYLSGLLSEDPQLAYYSRLYGGGGARTPNQRRYFQGQGQQDIWGQYLASQGQGLATAFGEGKTFAQALESPALTQTWYDYLGAKPFEQRWQELSPGERGMSTSRYAPPVRWVR